MARAKKKNKTSVKVNFKGVESRRTPPEGDYKCRVLEAVSDEGPSGDMIVVTSEIAAGEYKGQKLKLYCPLSESSLWKLHAFLTALGMDVPEDDMDIDLGELVDQDFMGVITHELYNGRKQAKLTDFTSMEDYDGDAADDDDEDEDDKPKKKGKGKKASKGKSKSDDDEDEDEAPAKKGKKSKSKKSDDDDDDDEDEKPAKGKKAKGGKKSKKKTYDRDEVEDMDEDELEEVIEESGIDVDLDDYKKLPKKVAAVIEALEEDDLLDD